MPFVVRNARAEDVPRLTELMHEYIVGFIRNHGRALKKYII